MTPVEAMAPLARAAHEYAKRRAAYRGAASIASIREMNGALMRLASAAEEYAKACAAVFAVEVAAGGMEVWKP